MSELKKCRHPLCVLARGHHSELKELIYDNITNATLKEMIFLGDVDKDMTERDKHFVEATELILAAFKAHIEECKPEVPLRWRKAQNRRVPGSGAVASSLTTGFLEGIEDFRKALMESLEEEKG